MVMTGQARLSTPSSKVDQAQIVPIVEPRHSKNKRRPHPTARLAPIEKGPQTSHAPSATTRVAGTALIVVQAWRRMFLENSGIRFWQWRSVEGGR